LRGSGGSRQTTHKYETNSIDDILQFLLMMY
jgi:hypothetical protein